MKSDPVTRKVTPTHWGMAGVFPGEFGLWKGDEWANHRRFVAEQGFHGGAISPDTLIDPARLKVLREVADSHGQVQSVHIHLDYKHTPTANQATLTAQIAPVLTTPVPVNCVGVVVSGGGNRFDREFPITRQLEILAASLRPLVEKCRAAGLPVAIENHGDYYLSDLVTLCAMVPGLEILLDTGNCFLIGERPDLIPDEVFPLVRATHWKDHWVRPNPEALTFDLTGATLGEGHVGLHAIYQRLLDLHPDPASIRMLIEWVPDPAKNPLDCFAASLSHLRKISDCHFPNRS